MAENIHDEEVLGKAYDSRLMRRLLTYLRPYKVQVAIALVAIAIKAGADVLGPYLTKAAVDKYLAPRTPPKHSWLGSHLSANAIAGINQIAGLYLGLLLVSFFMEYAQTYYMQWTGQKVMFDLRSQIFRHLQQMHIGFFYRNPVGQLVNREKPAYEKFEKINASHMEAFKDAIMAYAVYYPVVEVLSSIAIACVIWFGGRQVREVASLGVLTAFIQYAQRFFRPIQDMSEKYNILQSAMASSERIFKLVDTPAQITSPAVARTPAGPGRIEFDHVWFAYRNLPAANDG